MIYKNKNKVLLVAVLALACPIFSANRVAIDSRTTFARLKVLVGTWNATEKGNPRFAETVSYSMTGRGTVLIEQFQGATSTMGHMLTAYHLDVDQLVLTHFCGAGNQP